MDLAAKSALLQATLRDLGSVLVAYSGGTDSAYLTYAAHQALGENMLAVIADSASLPRAELAAALAFTAQHNIPTQILQTNELESPDYQRNDAHRCFHCKDELFTHMEQARAARNFAHIAYGMNLDDTSPGVAKFRPGQQAAAQHHAVAPLVTAQLTKAEIRQLAREANLSLADKPASACLASRIEYGRPVTRENLSQVEQAEAALHTLGFPQVRVRHHGDLARIEIAREDLPRALSLPILEKITAAIKPLGF
ncbi:MAG TPA: ATP-dependent sacrificial sulfur transferase LarE, partial [Edaphobacter sp.]|nr:ATP-dependent sacrificial sulfur transferase LarE [Edaphobacter sp.]